MSAGTGILPVVPPAGRPNAVATPLPESALLEHLVLSLAATFIFVLSLARNSRMAKIFISYSHAQGEFVCRDLIPVLRAGNVEVLWDGGDFEAGRSLIGQMDATHDQADLQLMLLSEE